MYKFKSINSLEIKIILGFDPNSPLWIRKLNFSNLCFCLIKQNLKEAQLDDTKQRIASRFLYFLANASYADKSYIGLELPTSFPSPSF